MARAKVLLKEAVDDLGVAGDVCTVARGYARNYLIPNDLAVWASKSALKQASEIRRIGLMKLARQQDEARAKAEVLRGKRLLFTANAGETNRLYGSVTAADIVDRIRDDAALGIAVDRRLLLLEGPIRQLGVYPITIRLMKGIETYVEVGVVREGESWDRAEEYKNQTDQVTADEPEPEVSTGTELPTEDREILSVLAEMDKATDLDG